MSRHLLLRSTLAIVLLVSALQGAADGGVGRYRVTINLFPGEDAGLVARQLAATYRGRLEPYGEEGFTGFMIVTTDASAQLLSRDPRVVLVEAVRSEPVSPAPALAPDAPAGPSSPTPAPRQVRTDATGSTWSIGPYAYDGSGNISAIGRGDTTSDTFVYDAFGRLKSGMVGTITRKQDYTYDAFGNILTITTDGDTTNQTKLGVDPTTNRITRSSDPSTGEVFNAYGGYDGAGNMEWNSAGDTFSYDSLGMLRESTVAGVRKVYLYTPDDERIASVTVVNGAKQSAEWTLRDPGGMGLRRYYESASGTWTWSEDYIYQGTRLLAAEVNAPEKTLHFFPDHLGTPRLITGNGGAEFSRRAYYPFGRQASASPGDYEKKGFTGHERDDPSLDYMHARSYLSLWGRFLSVDPADDVDLADPQSWNTYTYVRNDPVNATDPTGMFSMTIDVKATAESFDAVWDAFRQGMSEIRLFPIDRRHSRDRGPYSRTLTAYNDGWKTVWNRFGADNTPEDEADALIIAVSTIIPFGKLAKPLKKPALSAVRRALAKVHGNVGKLPKGRPGKFGSPQRGTSKKGYRLDPPHPNALPGSPESGWHINYWDYTQGKRGAGGVSGAVAIE